MKRTLVSVATSAVLIAFTSAPTARADEPPKPAEGEHGKEAPGDGHGAGETKPGAAKDEKSQHHGEIRGGEDVAHEHGLVGLDFVAGLGKVGEGGSSEKLQTLSFVLSGRYHIASAFALTLGVPLTQRSGDASAFALGNLRLTPAYEIEINEDFVIPLELAIALPTAQTGTRARAANEAAALSRGFEEDELFVAHRFGLIPTVNVEIDHKYFDLAAYTELPFLVHEGAEDPLVKENKVAVEWITAGEFLGQITGEHNCHGCLHVLAGPRAWYAYFLKDELPDAGGAKGQFVLEPTVRLMKGPIRARAGYILPIGGRLHHGETNVSGLRLGVGSVF